MISESLEASKLVKKVKKKTKQFKKYPRLPACDTGLCETDCWSLATGCCQGLLWAGLGWMLAAC